jgi:hypothetical protein
MIDILNKMPELSDPILKKIVRENVSGAEFHRYQGGRFTQLEVRVPETSSVSFPRVLDDLAKAVTEIKKTTDPTYVTAHGGPEEYTRNVRKNYLFSMSGNVLKIEDSD